MTLCHAEYIYRAHS